MRSTNLRLLLQRGGSRRLFFASIAASFIWVAVIVASGLVLARVIVAIINQDSTALSLIAILAALWAFRPGELPPARRRRSFAAAQAEDRSQTRDPQPDA